MYAQVDPNMGDLGTKTNQMRVSISSSWLRLGEIWPQECMKADIANETHCFFKVFGAQDGSKLAQVGAKLAQVSPS